MESILREIYHDFKVKVINGEYWVVANSEMRPNAELKIAKIPDFIRYPKAVAEAIAEGLNKNKKLCLTDLI